MLQAPGRLFFAIRDLSTERMGGMAMYSENNPTHGASELGYIWFAPALQRTPLATEALYLMLRHAFDDLKYRRMQWRCNALNQVYKGRNRDTAWYSMLDSEWPRIRSNFQRWLAPENFDEQGRQRTSLRALNAVG